MTDHLSSAMRTLAFIVICIEFPITGFIHFTGSRLKGGIIHIFQKALRAVPGCPPGQYAPATEHYSLPGPRHDLAGIPR